MPEEKKVDLKKEDLDAAEALGLNQKDAEQIAGFGDFYPNFRVPDDGRKAFAVFASDKLKKVTTADGVRLTTPVTDPAGLITYTLWISPGSSAAREYFKLRLQHNHALKGTGFAIWKEPYMHDKWGEVMATRMQPLTKSALERLAKETAEGAKVPELQSKIDEDKPSENKKDLEAFV